MNYEEEEGDPIKPSSVLTRFSLFIKRLFQVIITLICVILIVIYIISIIWIIVWIFTGIDLFDQFNWVPNIIKDNVL